MPNWGFMSGDPPQLPVCRYSHDNPVWRMLSGMRSTPMAVFNKRPRVGRNLFAPTRFYREPLIRDISQIQEQAKVKSRAVNPLSFVIKIGNRGKSYGSTTFIGEGDHVLFIGPRLAPDSRIRSRHRQCFKRSARLLEHTANACRFTFQCIVVATRPHIM